MIGAIMTDQVQQNNENPFATPESFRAHLATVQAEAIKVDNPNIENNKTEKISDDIPTEKASIPDKETMVKDDKGDESNDDVEYVLEQDKENTRVNSAEKEPRLIPKSRLKQETEKRRVAEEQLMKEREERIRFETELKTFKELQTKQTPQAQIQQEPDLEHLDALDQDAHKLYSKKIKYLEEEFNKLKQNTNQQTESFLMRNLVDAQRKEFEKNTPDFEEAFEFYINKELEAAKLYFDDGRKSETQIAEEADRAVKDKLANIAKSETRKQKNSAEFIYKQAKIYGYNPANIPEEKPNSKEPNVDLDAINRNKEKSASIGKIPNKANLGGNGNNILDFNQCLKDPKNPNSGVDPVKFLQYRKRLAKSAS
jgi:hypothetical protein